MGKERNWSQLLGWAIFGLVLAGGPLLNLFQSVTGITLPGFTLPALIALLMLASAGASIIRTVGGSRKAIGSDDARPMNQPMPSFGDGGTGLPRFGSAPPRMPPTGETPGTSRSDMPMPLPSSKIPGMPVSSVSAGMPSGEVRAPKFEPVVSPLMIFLGVVGAVLLMALGVIVFVAP
jgi:hypothetical protein